MLVGNTYAGKSSLISSYLQNKFVDDHEPTVLDVYHGNKKISNLNVEVELAIHDTSGEDDFV